MRFALFFICLFSLPALAQVAPAQLIVLEATQAVSERRFADAEQLYNKALALDPSNGDIYIHRAVMRRELENTGGMEQDAKTAISLGNSRIAVNPNDAKAYWLRGMGYRLLKDFKSARQDLENAIRLSGKNNWQADLQAMALEEKIGGVRF